MMILLVLILPLAAALACLAFSQAVSTRLLGVGAGAALLLSGAALLALRLRGSLPLPLLDYVWMAVDNRPLHVMLALDTLGWAPALLALFGGAIGLLTLALTLPPNLRGFGGLLAAAVLAVLATVAGLAIQSPLLLPLAWAPAALLAFVALRASGALAGSDAPVIVLLAGLGGALLALGAALLGPDLALDTPAGRAALVAWVLLGALSLGAPPFQAAQQRLAEAPAALAGILMTLGWPLLGGVALIRFFAGLAAPLPAGWRLGLTALGALMLVVCAAGAAGTTQLRRQLSWQLSAQLALPLVALAQGGPAMRAAALALLANAMLSTLVCYLAVAILERRAGTDDLAELKLRQPLVWPGALFLAGAASAIGLPGFWGLWPRIWLLGALLDGAPLAVAPLLAGGALLALSFIPALAAFWRRAGAPALAAESAAPAGRLSPLALVGVAGALPLVIGGAMPQLAWRGWLAGVSGLESAARLPSQVGQLLCALAALLLLAGPLVLRSGRAAAEGDSAGAAGALATAALGESLAGLAQIGTATAIFTAVWEALLRGSRLLLRGLALLEQRYYLAGLLIAVILVIMLFIQ
jgi:formate hydrogenlyase subunit 3/multisubunit Na+/H+ antiporter MnhD subunit